MDKRIIAVLIVVIVAVAAIAIGVSQFNKGNDGGDRTITDSRGRSVEVPKDIETILCHNCCSLELTSYFDAVNKVCAMDADDKINPNKTYTQVYKAKLESLPTVECKGNFEQVIALNPSIVISSTVSVQELDNMQEKIGIPVFAINADLEFGDQAWFDQINRLGDLFGEKSRANAIVDGVKGIILDIKAGAISGGGVFGYACGMMFYGGSSTPILRTTGDFLPFELCGIVNVMPSSSAGVGKQPYDTDVETLISKQYDYMYVDGTSAAAVQEYIIENRDLLDSKHPILAFITGDVYKTMVYKMWGTQWDNQLINCLYAAKILSPDHYEWEFEEKANQVFDILYGEGKYTYSQVVNKCGVLPIE